MSDTPDTVYGALLARLRGQALTASDRLSQRRTTLIAASLLSTGFIISGGLAAPVALAGVGALGLWAILAPLPDARYFRSGRAAQLGNAEGADAGVSTWRNVIDSLPDPAIALDATGDVLMLNGPAQELFPGAGPGRHLSQITRAPELLVAVDNALQHRQAQVCRMDFKVPVERTLVGTVAPLKPSDQSGDAPHLLVVLRDLSEQDRLVRMRADFVANASHELRTPLASLKGFVETLQGAAKDDPVARENFLRIMQQQAERMARLIEDLLSLSRIEMRAHVVPRESVDIGSVIAHVVQTLGGLAKQKAITLDAEKKRGVMVTGDRDELVQVFQNLIENAIKYGRPGGRVAVSYAQTENPAQRGNSIAIAIADDGPGIAPEHLPRLTERFYRVSATQSRNKGGTGLGLAIVKHVLNRHRAELQIESVVGKGSVFRVVLPAP